MKLLVTPTSFLKPANAEARSILESYTSDIVYNETGEPLSGEQLLSRLDGCDGYLAGVDYITADVVERMPGSIRAISRYGAGVDRVDLEACRKRGIILTNTPGANATAVCELAFALMLAVARSVPSLDRQVRQGAWPRANGMELAGKHLGILGLGAIGKKLALRAQAFDMQISAYDPYIDEAFASANGVRVESLDDVFKTSDVISLHLPLSADTRYIVSKKRMQLMKAGSIIINTARGGLIDEQAAAELLLSGHLRGLGLDAFEQEPLVDSPLKNIENVVFTPHTGAHTPEAVTRMGIMAVENLIAILSKKECKYIVH